MGYLDLNFTGYYQTASQYDGTSLHSQQQFMRIPDALQTP